MMQEQKINPSLGRLPELAEQLGNSLPQRKTRGCTHLGAPDWLLLTGGFPTRAGVCCRARHLGIREAHYGEYRPGGDGVVGWLVRGSPPR